MSPSWGGGARLPTSHRTRARHLQSLGFKVKIAPHTLDGSGFVSDTPAKPGADIHAMFLDPEVKAIIASIGGDHSCHLLPLLDFNLITAHPRSLWVTRMSPCSTWPSTQDRPGDFQRPGADDRLRRVSGDVGVHRVLFSRRRSATQHLLDSWPRPIGRPRRLSIGGLKPTYASARAYAGHRLDMAQAWPGRRPVNRRMH